MSSLGREHRVVLIFRTILLSPAREGILGLPQIVRYTNGDLYEANNAVTSSFLLFSCKAFLNPCLSLGGLRRQRDSPVSWRFCTAPFTDPSPPLDLCPPSWTFLSSTPIHVLRG